MSRTAADVIVIGAGAAGAVLAARLSEDPDRRVLLLEAGPAPRSISEFPSELLDASRVLGARPFRSRNWTYNAELAHGRPFDLVRGRMLGGSTSINGGYFIRPTESDLTRWAELAGPEWSLNRSLDLWRGIETDLEYATSPLHGDRGPIPISRAQLDSHPASAAFYEASLAAGYPDESDKNAFSEPGIGPVPTNSLNGVRWNVAVAYLFPALARPNLQVRAHTEVESVVVRGRRAVAVQTRAGRFDGAEIVVAAGALESPRILARSGLDPRSHAFFRDHPQVIVGHRPASGGPAPESTWMGAALHANIDDATVEILQSLRPMSALVGESATANELNPLLISVNDNHEQRSVIDLVSGRIEYNYLGSSRARFLMRRAVRMATDLVESHGALGLHDVPDDALSNDSALDAWIHSRLGTSVHSGSSIPAGSVVDGFGVLQGVAGVRVADTSIIPDGPSRGPAASAVFIGELVAREMRRV